MKNRVLLFIVILISSLTACRTVRAEKNERPVNPRDYGLNRAKTGEERYNALLRAHQEAKRVGRGVTYKGIKRIDLTIPPHAKSIPLGQCTDFAGVTINVINNQKRVALFTLSNESKQVQIPPLVIDNGDFSRIPELNKGRYLLTVRDKNPWVKERIGYGYSFYRGDAMIIVDGTSQNKPVMPYDNKNSLPECYYCPVSGDTIIIKNLVFNRDNNSTQITGLFDISMEANVVIDNVKLYTPEGHNMYSDAIIKISNSYNITLKDIYARGSYSQKNNYGYVFEANNVYGLKVNNVDAEADWGVFGNNNLNNVVIEDSRINRFDIHCYGRDIICKRCRFEGLYNQFSSTYGQVSFEDCVFDNFTPYLNAGSYNAFVPVDITFERCTFNITPEKNAIIKMSGLTEEVNPRPELEVKCMPNVIIKDCSAIATGNIDVWYIIHPGGVRYQKPIGYIDNIDVDIKMGAELAKKMVALPKYVKTRNKVNLVVNE